MLKPRAGDYMMYETIHLLTCMFDYRAKYKISRRGIAFIIEFYANISVVIIMNELNDFYYFTCVYKPFDRCIKCSFMHLYLFWERKADILMTHSVLYRAIV